MYRGRFAPSPTGPLHFGSLVTAVASYVYARQAAGIFLVRIEDVDVPRCVPGSAENILQTLVHFGLQWDEPVMYQTARTAAYEAALSSLRRQGLIYACTCSRKDVGSGEYPGTCRSRKDPPMGSHAIRVEVHDESLGGDFIVRRSDGIFSYQLAVVVDDAAQQITHVVRGDDLLESTPRQVYLQRLLGYTTPQYIHVPVVTNDAGQKLSKQTQAPALDWSRKTELLERAIAYLERVGCLAGENL